MASNQRFGTPTVGIINETSKNQGKCQSHIKTQSVPRSKHTPTQLYKPVS